MEVKHEHPTAVQPKRRGYLRLEFISERSTRAILAGQVWKCNCLGGGWSHHRTSCCWHRDKNTNCAHPLKDGPIVVNSIALQRLAGLLAYGVMAWEISAQ